tara:strand:- start:4 stop:180 length:177 start_codon:yes stop_codon:yes gene_type:complete
MKIIAVKKVNGIHNEFICYSITRENIDAEISIPHCEENSDYQEVLKWVAEGNTIEEAD